jgi:two-component system, LuxR family, response regulator FixJ
MDAADIVHVVDDDEAVRASIRFLLEGAGFQVRTYTGATHLFTVELPAFGCILMDVQMPELDGLILQARLAERGITLPVIVMSGHGDVPIAVQAMKAGAVDFLEKPFEEDDLISAVRRALDQNHANHAAATKKEDASRRLALLTPREREVLDLLVLGRSNKEVARSLGTSPRTIDVHRAHLNQKLGTTTLAELVHLTLAAR